MPTEAQSKAGWRKYRFDEIALNVNERVDDPSEAGVEHYIGLEHLDSDSLAIRRWGSPRDVQATKLRFRKGDIIFGRRRVYQRKLGVADFDGICSAHAMVLRAKHDVVLPEFLPFFMQSDLFMERAKEISVGSLSPTINWPALAREAFPLPPLDEQRRIATALGEADAAHEMMLRLISVTDLSERAAFDDLLGRSDAPSEELGSLLRETPRNGYSAVEASAPTGHWVLALSALTKSGYRAGELKAVVKTEAVAAATLRPGDLLISRSNTRELVGLAGTFNEDRSDVSWPDTMMRLRPDLERVRSAFLERFLRSAEGRRQIQSFAAGTSASMKKINATHVQKLRFKVPPLGEQDEIVRLCDGFSRARQQIDARLAHLSALKAALLLGLSVVKSSKSHDCLQRGQHRRSVHPRPAVRQRHAPHRRRPRPRAASRCAVRSWLALLVVAEPRSAAAGGARREPGP